MTSRTKIASTTERCSICHGTGHAPLPGLTYESGRPVTAPCRACRGSGLAIPPPDSTIIDDLSVACMVFVGTLSESEDPERIRDAYAALRELILAHDPVIASLLCVRGDC